MHADPREKWHFNIITKGYLYYFGNFFMDIIICFPITVFSIKSSSYFPCYFQLKKEQLFS